MSHQVIIVGAGIAGIAAAHTLATRGSVSDFLILEAGDYVGGRLQSVSFGGQVFEAGANWVHGTIHPETLKENPISALVRAANIRGHNSNSDDSETLVKDTATGKDVTLPAKVRGEELEAAAEQLHDKLCQQVESEEWSIRNDISVREGLKLNGWQPLSALDRTLEYFEWDFQYAEMPEITSAYHNVLEEFTEVDFGEMEFFVNDPRGFSTIVKHLCTECSLDPEKDPRLKLGRRVTEIEHTCDGVKVHALNLQSNCVEVYQAAQVVVTVSIGVLQRSSELLKFSPALPTWKTEQFTQFQMALYCKIFVAFPRAFWEQAEYLLLVTEERGQYPVWQPVPGRPILIATVTGEKARRVEQLDDSEVVAEFLPLLRAVYSDVPQPTAVHGAYFSGIETALQVADVL
ncbi:hypothetical protein CYMTET_43655 [Cymbomonas tetramitiformis]|uniref:Amine oxidase domain-containing protein n=1 Tax=Cymbomonas tetramitiformis TaxID=36881 RepID=A0AAE0C3N3_9CHLO|nr:hypothetical protein CYMTET_43655 [Cymbomonas tetramitiformis]